MTRAPVACVGRPGVLNHGGPRDVLLLIEKPRTRTHRERGRPGPGRRRWGAVAGSLITSDDIQDKTIKKADLAKDSVVTKKVKDGSLKLKDLDKAAHDTIKKGGPQGPGSGGAAGRARPGWAPGPARTARTGWPRRERSRSP